MKKNTTCIAALLVALAIGIVVGVSFASGQTAEPKLVTKTETVTKTVNATPASCVAALDAAEDTFDVFNDGYGIVEQILEAASVFDEDGMTQAVDDFTDHSPSLTSSLRTYDGLADTCRGAS